MFDIRFGVAIRDLPLDSVLAVLDALEDAGFWSGDMHNRGDWPVARNAARTHCNTSNPAASPARLNEPSSSEAPL